MGNDRDPRTIQLDFRDRQELLNAIGIQAHAEFRSIRGQIMAILVKHCKNKKPVNTSARKVLQRKKICDACRRPLGKDRYFLENGDIVCKECFALNEVENGNVLQMPQAARVDKKA